MLFNINTLSWDEELCSFFEIPSCCLPEVCSSAEVYGNINQSKLIGTPISGILGDQQAALVGQGCVNPGKGFLIFSARFLIQSGTYNSPSQDFWANFFYFLANLGEIWQKIGQIWLISFRKFLAWWVM